MLLYKRQQGARKRCLVKARLAPGDKSLAMGLASQLGPLDIERLLENFEEAWRQGASPRIEAFLAGAGDIPGRRQLLEELICIDLDYRWRDASRRSGNQSPPSLHDYLQRFPELGSGDELACSLIGSEYRIRKHWGDRPSHEAYQARFPRHGARLGRLLMEIDAELAADMPASGDVPMGIALPSTAAPAAALLAIGTVAALLDILRQTGLLTAEQLDEVAGMQGRFADPRGLAGELVRRDWLTPYQVNELFLGRGRELVLSSYVLLQRLGEGGTGRVFKARHQGLQRVVALKVIRQELLTDPEVVSRFYREIRLVSKLTSPHIVHAYDAGPVGPTHFLTMEYLEGTDLRRLVKTAGPLPVHQAVEYIRQAALGLQHIFEHQLVHRDLKPSNLFLVSGGVVSGEWSKLISSGAMSSESSKGCTTHHSPLTTHQAVVKILDLGLGRWRRAQEPGTGEENSFSSLTPAGSVMVGTPDYLAPEQALDFHAADIRADIYSLGCTFYYLLTGKPPFPGGTLAQKLLMHQQAAPPPLEQFRSDLPVGLAAVVGRMMAKSPAERYATPAELAGALAELANGAALRNGPGGPAARPVTARELLQERRAPARTWRPILVGSGILAVALVVFAFLLVSSLREPSSGTSAVQSVPAEPMVNGKPISIWGNSSETPVETGDSDPRPVELGVKFRSEVTGLVTGVRFYKTPKNTGPHNGSLWSHTGARLARASFASETASGWQQADFARPVPIQANTTYVASYFLDSRFYAHSRNYFAAAVRNGPLQALANGVDGPNGVFKYNPVSTFPDTSYDASNYWVDVVFTPER
jgi:serine/threonine protein kinase